MKEYRVTASTVAQRWILKQAYSELRISRLELYVVIGTERAAAADQMIVAHRRDMHLFDPADVEDEKGFTAEALGGVNFQHLGRYWRMVHEKENALLAMIERDRFSYLNRGGFFSWGFAGLVGARLPLFNAGLPTAFPLILWGSAHSNGAVPQTRLAYRLLDARPVLFKEMRDQWDSILSLTAHYAPIIRAAQLS